MRPHGGSESSGNRPLMRRNPSPPSRTTAFGEAMRLPGSWSWQRGSLLAAAICASVVTCATTAARAQDWPVFSGDLAATRYSAAAEITRRNLARLELAWRWRPDEAPVPRTDSTQPAVPGAFESTPLAIGDTLYVVTPYSSGRRARGDRGTGALVVRSGGLSVPAVGPQPPSADHASRRSRLVRRPLPSDLSERPMAAGGAGRGHRPAGAIVRARR